ncbi:MAG TPA: outer membrane beta-barrel protein [Chitinophagaceae bacterium]
MKKILVLVAALIAAGNLMAQSDTTVTKSDTLVVGNFIIIKKDRKASSSDTSEYQVSKRKNKSNISTNWAILDVGFANVRDETSYGSAETNAYLFGGSQHFSEQDMKLRTSKTSNVNLWFFMQKLNVSRHVLNLKYGMGLEMYNFRYSKNISYRENIASGNPGVFRDSVEFSKNKLYAGYITVPFMLNVNFTPERRKGFSLSAGISAGYLIGSRNKQVSNARGKQKFKGDFDLEKWRLAYIAELGLGPVRLYGSYSINPLHERGLKQYPYAVGIRFSNF